MNLSKSRILIIASLALMITLSLGLLVQAADAKKSLGQYTLDQIIQFKSLPSYQEAPELDKLVKDGKLPPLKDRLPKEPKILTKNNMVDGIGQYGGVWRDTFAVPIDGWNWGAGNVQGYFGIHQILHEALVLKGPMWKLKEPEPVPNLAKGWEWSKDGKTLTMHLIEGAKWSDGQPFTAEDVAFTYNNLILDEQITSTATADDFTFGGKVTDLEVVDDYTIKWHFGAAYPISVFSLLDRDSMPISPKHVYKQFHPAYNKDAKYEDYPNVNPPQNLPVVTMGPWVPVKYKSSQQLVLVRNPYYWQVDENGNQLPYISEIHFMEAESGETRTYNVVAGKGDRTNLENPSTFTMVKQESLKDGANFKISFGPYTSVYRLEMNFSKYFGAKTDRQLEVRKLFRDKKFREALSYAVDRNALAKGAFPGPMTMAWYGGYPMGSIYHSEDNIVKYNFDPAKAKQLLAELGFKDTNGDGILNWPADSKIAGQELILQLKTNEDSAASVKAAEALVPMLREVGIRVKMQVLSGPINTAKTNSGDWELQVARVDQLGTPFYYMDLVGSISSKTPAWHQEGSQHQRELLPFEKQIANLLSELRTTRSLPRRKEILAMVEHLSTQNIYNIGLYQLRQGIAMNNRFKNVQPDLPPYLYDYMVNEMPLQVVWVPKDQQYTPQFLNEIPVSASK